MAQILTGNNTETVIKNQVTKEQEAFIKEHSKSNKAKHTKLKESNQIDRIKPLGNRVIVKVAICKNKSNLYIPSSYNHGLAGEVHQIEVFRVGDKAAKDYPELKPGAICDCEHRIFSAIPRVLEEEGTDFDYLYFKLVADQIDFIIDEEVDEDNK